MNSERKPRTTIKALVDDGALRPEAVVECEKPGGGRIMAKVTAEGKIRLPDGQEFVSPSGAAKAARGVVLNGWVAWREARTGRTLAEIRKVYLIGQSSLSTGRMP